MKTRFLREAAHGGSRYVSWGNQDACTAGLLRTLAVIEDEHLLDRITVMRRDGTVLHANELHDGTWRHIPGAEQAVKTEQARPWSARETFVFRKELERAGKLLHGEPLPADKRLAVQRDSERVAALAEPVRRIAQPTAAPPGVTYHRLSADEHQWIFKDLIVPAHLARTTKRTDPQAVYVLGKPGIDEILRADLNAPRKQRHTVSRIFHRRPSTTAPRRLYLIYVLALADGWPITSGVLEGPCRYIVKDRMGITGARWSLPGAEAVLNLRTLVSNDDFDRYWACHLRREHHRTHANRSPETLTLAA